MTRQPSLLSLLDALALFTTFRMARMEGWDDAFYLAQTLSVVSDGDLLLQDDLAALPNPEEQLLLTGGRGRMAFSSR